jgi:hypothetical protein
MGLFRRNLTPRPYGAGERKPYRKETQRGMASERGADFQSASRRDLRSLSRSHFDRIRKARSEDPTHTQCMPTRCRPGTLTRRHGPSSKMRMRTAAGRSVRLDLSTTGSPDQALQPIEQRPGRCAFPAPSSLRLGVCWALRFVFAEWIPMGVDRGGAFALTVLRDGLPCSPTTVKRHCSHENH